MTIRVECNRIVTFLVGLTAARSGTMLEGVECAPRKDKAAWQKYHAS